MSILLDKREIRALRDVLECYYESNSDGAALAAVVQFILDSKEEPEEEKGGGQG